jgi:two-component system cell cycle sensor histidine kinase/response regulator CckA
MLPLNLALDVRVPDSPACARADASAIEQILLNLVNNARDATPDGGRVAVEVEIVEVSEQLAQSHSGMVQGSYVRLTVRDDGTGMRDDVRARAFEPFFTTKARGHGVGLGLSTVYGLAKQLGGFVYLSSEPQAGATATLFFPHAPDVVAYDAAPSAGDRSDLGGATILVVEDEEPLRRATARVLKRLGYAVVEARNGLEALDVLRERPSDVDLVLSDVVMPDLGGRGLYDAMQELPGRPPVLFVSGYSAEDLRDGDLLDPSFDLLQKPWAIPELIDGIRRALAAGPAPREELVGGRRY